MGVLGLTRTGLLLWLTGGVLAIGMTTGCNTKETPPDPLDGYRMAVVDLKPLLELHPNYSKLEQLNQEIGELQQKKMEIEKERTQELIAAGTVEMDAAMEKAKEKLEAERNAIEGEIAALNSSLSAQMNSEMSALQNRYADELEDEVEKIKKQMGAQDKPEDVPPPLETSSDGQLQDYLANLHLVRERNLAAKRLELEKRVGDEVAAKQSEVNSQIAAYEAELSGQYQSERLNLQLTAQNSTDEAAKTAAENRLSDISQEIETAKAARRDELEAGYAAVRSEKTAQVQQELEAYQTELNREVAAKLAAKQQELGLAAPRPSQPQQPSGPPP
ncbi:MAG: hypothetical protein WC423_05145, partial [Vulcanimicrobiota bacterium]